MQKKNLNQIKKTFIWCAIMADNGVLYQHQQSYMETSSNIF